MVQQQTGSARSTESLKAREAPKMQGFVGAESLPAKEGSPLVFKSFKTIREHNAQGI